MIELTPSKTSPYLGSLDEKGAQWFLGCQVWPRATSAQTGCALGLIEQIVPPGFGSPYHVHHNEDESFYLLEGEIRFFSEGTSWVLGKGGFAFLPRGIAHGFRTEGNVPSRSLIPAAVAGFTVIPHTGSTKTSFSAVVTVIVPSFHPAVDLADKSLRSALASF